MERYDPDSGQVFRETVVKVARKHGKRPSNRLPYVAPLRGAESLSAKAMREIVCNASTLTKETLEAAPLPIVHQIWKAIRREDRDNLPLWKVFVESGHGDRSFRHALTLGHTTLEKPIVDYFNDVTSHSFLWTTSIQLQNAPLSAANLKQLACIVNLQILQITYTRDHASQNRAEPSDESLSNWAFRAAKENAFSVLKVLLLRRTPRVTCDCFQALGCFPMLQTFVVEDTSITAKHRAIAKSHGWIRQLFVTGDTQKHALSNSFAFDGRLNSYNDRAFKDSFKDFVEHRRSSDQRFASLPVLDVCFARKQGADTLGEVLHFERMWPNKVSSQVDNRRTSATTRTDFTADKPDTDRSGPVSNKKRKLRDGRAIQLDKLFDIF